MKKMKVPPYPYKEQTFSLKWAQEYMKKIGAKPITEEDKKRDPSLRAACKMTKT